MSPVRLLTLSAVSMLAITLTSPLAAQQRVYQWKDANGVTHYADTAPATRHQARDIDTHTGNATTPDQPAAAAPAESEQCRNARANLKRLQSNAPIGIDTNGDGKPDRNLSADERKAQIDLNTAAVKAFCPSATP
jgi:hypothetical protein